MPAFLSLTYEENKDNSLYATGPMVFAQGLPGVLLILRDCPGSTSKRNIRFINVFQPHEFIDAREYSEYIISKVAPSRKPTITPSAEPVPMSVYRHISDTFFRTTGTKHHLSYDSISADAATRQNIQDVSWALVDLHDEFPDYFPCEQTQEDNIVLDIQTMLHSHLDSALSQIRAFFTTNPDIKSWRKQRWLF